jgi:tetratricopeptide (TPR) repeat protein
MNFILLAIAIYSTVMQAVDAMPVQPASVAQHVTPIPPEILELSRAVSEERLKARALIMEGRYDQAERVIRAALIRFGDNDLRPYLYTELSEIRLRQGRYQEAYDLIDKDRPELSDGRRYARIAFLKAQLGDYLGSKAMWDDAGPVGYIKDSFVDDWPNVYDINGLKMAWLLVIGDLAGVGDKLGAEFYLHLAEGSGIESPIVDFYLGNFAFEKKDYAKSAELLKKAEYGFHGDVAKGMAHDCWMRADYQKWLHGRKG